MEATPFSPFVGKLKKTAFKRRQSELPSDLIDWEAPEIPELEKQRIIYEDYIKELNEDHDIESLLNEQIFFVAHNSIVDEYQTKLKSYENDVTKERSKVNLLLGQLKMFEANVQENNERVDDLEKQLEEQRQAISKLEEEKENLLGETTNLQTEIENLNFRFNETTCESNHNLELYMQKKNEVEDVKRNLSALKNQLAYYKKLAKNRNVNDDD